MEPGKVYVFKYDPKTKEKLLIYDKVPFIFMLEKYRDGFLGLNLHYVRLRERDAFLKILLSQMKRTKSGKIQVPATYRFISALLTRDNTDKMVKRYLTEHLRSVPKEIEPNDWLRVANLPLARWVRK